MSLIDAICTRTNTCSRWPSGLTNIRTVESAGMSCAVAGRPRTNRPMAANTARDRRFLKGKRAKTSSNDFNDPPPAVGFLVPAAANPEPGSGTQNLEPKNGQGSAQDASPCDGQICILAASMWGGEERL